MRHERPDQAARTPLFGVGGPERVEGSCCADPRMGRGSTQPRREQRAGRQREADTATAPTGHGAGARGSATTHDNLGQRRLLRRRRRRRRGDGGGGSATASRAGGLRAQVGQLRRPRPLGLLPSPRLHGRQRLRWRRRGVQRLDLALPLIFLLLWVYGSSAGHSAFGACERRPAARSRVRQVRDLLPLLTCVLSPRNVRVPSGVSAETIPAQAAAGGRLAG